MKVAPIILVPGFWLGAWAWDDVTGLLTTAGHEVRALTLPGLESRHADRAKVSLEDHTLAITRAVMEVRRPVVLVVHSGASIPGYQVCDRVPGNVAAIVYIDHGPVTKPLDPDFSGIELPLPRRAEMDADDVRGMSDAEWTRFQERAVPEPGALLREAPRLADDRRRHIPTTIVCTTHTADQYRAWIPNGWPMLSGVPELTHVSSVDLPTHH